MPSPPEHMNPLVDKSTWPRGVIPGLQSSINVPVTPEGPQVDKTIADAKAEMENIKAQIILLKHWYLVYVKGMGTRTGSQGGDARGWGRVTKMGPGTRQQPANTAIFG
jgi:hypothetical protein